MSVSNGCKSLGLFCVIVNYGAGSRAWSIARHNGVTGATILLGRGTVRNRILEFLELADIRKEIVMMVADWPTGNKAMDVLVKELDLAKPNHGIGFTIPVRCVNGQHDSGGAESPMYNAIFIVADKGQADEVISAANSAGARGATVINARGSGVHETAMLFSMPIEPEKEVVLILAKAEFTEPICTAVRERCKIDEPGRGIIFVLDVKDTYGLY
jgi:nitrogen regulatory protein PII